MLLNKVNGTRAVGSSGERELLESCFLQRWAVGRLDIREENKKERMRERGTQKGGERISEHR